MASIKLKNDPFSQKKQFILNQIEHTDSEHTDASPKGTLDEHLLDLIRLINKHEDMVTTSSCSGRLSVFLEGDKTKSGSGGSGNGEEEEEQAGGREKIGGKGAGGKWLFVTHEPNEVRRHLQSGEVGTGRGSGENLEKDTGATQVTQWWWPAVKAYSEKVHPGGGRRYVLYKFEAMILHVKCRNRQTANALYTSAMACGFRETGIGSNDIVGIRISIKLDVPLGYIDSSISRTASGSGDSTTMADEDQQVHWLVDDQYVSELDRMTVSRFEENFRRRDQLFARIQADFFGQSSGGKNEDGVANNSNGGDSSSKATKVYEDKEARRERKRREGLKRQAELKGAEIGSAVVESGSGFESKSVVLE